MVNYVFPENKYFLLLYQNLFREYFVVKKISFFKTNEELLTSNVIILASQNEIKKVVFVSTAF